MKTQSKSMYGFEKAKSSLEFDKIIDYYENANIARKEVIEGKLDVELAG